MTRQRATRRVALLVALGASALLVSAGCVARDAAPAGAAGAAARAATASVAPASPASSLASDPSPPALQAILVSRSLWPGSDRILLALEDANNVPIGGPDVAVRVAVGSFGAWEPAAFERETAAGRGLYAADVTLPTPGDVAIAVEATAFGIPHATTVVAHVRDPGITPAIGARAPRVDTPTFAAAGGDLARVTTDPVPDRRLYWLSARRAIAEARPFVLVLDSYALRPSPACGGALGIVHHLADEFPSVSFIHAEAWATRWNGSALVADPIGGPLRPAPWTAAWGVSSAPWVFVVDGDGVVRGKFSGIVGTDELRAAIRSVAGWAPTY